MTHLIKPNKSCQVPSQHIILDTETLPGPPMGTRQTKVHKFRMACTSFFRWEKGKPTRRKEGFFTNAGECIQWILSILDNRRMTWVWSHSAMFDWTAIDLWEELEKRNITLKYGCMETRPNFLLCEREDSPIWWVDSLNWFRCSLENLGSMVQLPKLPMPSFTDSEESWQIYCQRDVQILEKTVIALLKWTTENNLGCLRVTAPGQAMQAYRHRFAPRQKLLLNSKKRDGTISQEELEVCLPITHSVKPVQSLERASYFQGTVRCNFIGKVQGPIYCYDVNSCYPSVMLDGMVPVELKEWDTNDKPRNPIETGPLSDLIAEVELHCGYPRYPLRCYSHACYPVGRFWTVLCGPELEYAYNREEILAFGRWSRYRLGNLFRNYVTELWGLRTNYQDVGNVVMSDLCKIMLNSLAGKFGQRGAKWKKRSDLIAPFPWGRFDEYDPKTNEWKYFRSMAWLVEEYQEQGEHPNGFPAVSAWITSLARVKMLKILEDIGNAGSIYYSAVDSIHGDAKVSERIVGSGYVGDGLGFQRLSSIGSKAEYRGIANYSIDGEMHVAGLPRNARCQDVATGIFDVKRIGTNLPTNRSTSSIFEYQNNATITPPYLHGRVNPDGWTRPWILPLEEMEMNKCLEKATVTLYT